ncbi:hypothetical protein FRX31_019632 [Thalictrum thalictroides]|uniref:Uncharacterized protein n=1 Tax=Thalictrum thalictroides TaxID=46969 RepID=A0A7J6W069_THATH|nr:hypothetical protein FRX31_019632 [Thalictrum thalictroides]
MEEENAKQRELPSITHNSVEKELTMTPAPYFNFQTHKPVWKLSPWNGGSTLYDSYELRAVTQQLNRTIQGSQTMYSPCLNHTKFIYPFRGYLDRVYKENAKTPKQLTASKSGDSAVKDKPKSLGMRKFMPRLWRTFKRMFFSKNVAAVCVCNQSRN